MTSLFDFGDIIEGIISNFSVQNIIPNGDYLYILNSFNIKIEMRNWYFEGNNEGPGRMSLT